MSEWVIAPRAPRLRRGTCCVSFAPRGAEDSVARRHAREPPRRNAVRQRACCPSRCHFGHFGLASLRLAWLSPRLSSGQDEEDGGAGVDVGELDAELMQNDDDELADLERDLDLDRWATRGPKRPKFAFVHHACHTTCRLCAQ